MTPAARIAAAIDLIGTIDAQPRRPADATVNDFFRTRRYIGSGDRRAVAERAWSVIRQRMRLDWHLGEIGAAQTARHLILAQLILVDGWKLEGLSNAFPGGGHAAEPLTPAETQVARALAKRSLIDQAMPEPIRYNVPAWALPGFQARFGERLTEVSAAMDQPAPLDLRANLLRTSREVAQKALAGEGIETELTPLSPWGLRIPSRRPISATVAYEKGLVEIQDEGSQLIALLTDAQPGMRVADYCAGAAGKTLAIAATMGNRGRIVACDVSEKRLQGAVVRLRRAGVDNAERHLLVPGDRFVKRRAEQFDRVLVDAPCTGTGTWRRNPDGRTRTGPQDLTELLEKQAVILDTASRLVRSGGKLVYATCSVLPEENEGQVDAFLARHTEFERVPLAESWAGQGLAVPPPCEGPDMALDPARHGTDGFFAAVLRRR
ncbi:RsmB/NOP family class I SAM-dependent RNA methyltransferase [Acetobacteraceae bacterium H6797]|nr:RsmB/NOP family class I SAM-dependent RNA methyltransferase [Acetobacteraceae bacterium H6797]